ncbi:MAG: hypothetical protein ACI8PB_003647 [Desulforhopalus sp.]|jgi:hypothetical protein
MMNTILPNDSFQKKKVFPPGINLGQNLVTVLSCEAHSQEPSTLEQLQ